MFRLFFRRGARKWGYDCSYWDEARQTWSSEGLRKVSGDENNPLVCSTTHLTIFGAIWRGITKTLECSNAKLLSEEGMAGFAASNWYTEAPAITIMCLLTVICLVRAIVAWSVFLRRASKSWPGSTRISVQLIDLSPACAIPMLACLS